MTKFRGARRTGSSLTVEFEGGKQIFFARDVRGSLVFPTSVTAGYYAICAQKEAPNEAGKAPLVLICEQAEEQPMTLFKKLLNHAQDFACREFLVDMRRENRDYISLFSEFSRYHRSSYVALRPAKFTQHFERSVGLIREWSSSLEIGKGIMQGQLARITVDDLAQNADSFFAIKALCFIIASLETEPWESAFTRGGFKTNRNIDRRDPGGWT